MRKAPPNARITSAEVNGGPALLLWSGDTLVNVVGYHIVDDQIQGVYMIVNPDKLEYIQRELHARATPPLDSG